MKTRIAVARPILEEDGREAAGLRRRLRRARVHVLNLMSGAGAGKTTLLALTLAGLRPRWRVGAIAGDIETRRDADRLERTGARVVQLNTHGDCHLEVAAVAGALDEIRFRSLDAVFVENVGNLVCPAEFDIGETDRAMMLSVAEGHDKPAKYPLMFRSSRAVILSKIDLLPHTDFDEEAALRDVRDLNPGAEVFRVSARTGEGVDAWIRWVDARIRAAKE